MSTEETVDDGAGVAGHKASHLVVVVVCVVLIVAVVAVAFGRPSTEAVFEPRDAPTISADDLDGEPFDLDDRAGNVTVLHFTAIEEPVCLECESQMREQLKELRDLRHDLDNATIVTVNMRKNPRSEDGRSLARTWWELEADWTWIEDWSPYPVSGPYDDYWNHRGAVSNPTIVLIDGDLRVVAVSHVYQMGSGEVDGVQGSVKLARDIEAIHAGEWEGFEGAVTTSRVTIGTMFALGVIPSLTPCSIALMAVVISYIMSGGRPSPGGSREGRGDAPAAGLTIGVTFTLGMAVVFFLIGCLLSQVGSLVSASDWFYLVAGILVIVLGVNGLHPISDLVPSGLVRWPGWSDGSQPRPGFLQLAMSRVSGDGSSGPVVGLVLGVLFSLAWAPCAVSLILPVLIWVVSQGYSWLVAGGLLFVFGLGHGVPVVPMAVLGRTARGRLAEKYVRVGVWVTRAFAVAVVVFGVILAVRFFGVALW